MEYENTKPVILTNNKNKSKTNKEKTFKTTTNKKNIYNSGKKIKPDEELPVIKYVGKDTGEKIQQARLNCKLKQKEVANKMNMDLSLYQKYENGTAQRNGNVLNKLGNILKVKLTGKGI